MTEYFVCGNGSPDEDGDISLYSTYARPDQEGASSAVDIRGYVNSVLYRVTPVAPASAMQEEFAGVWLVTVETGRSMTTKAFRTELEALRYAYPLEGIVLVHFSSFEESST